MHSNRIIAGDKKFKNYFNCWTSSLFTSFFAEGAEFASKITI